jgi:hypothetical protein
LAGLQQYFAKLPELLRKEWRAAPARLVEKQSAGLKARAYILGLLLPATHPQ